MSEQNSSTLDIPTLRRLLADATARPWSVAVEPPADWWGKAGLRTVVVNDDRPVCATNDDGIATMSEVANAALIAALVNHADALLAACEAGQDADERAAKAEAAYASIRAMNARLVRYTEEELPLLERAERAEGELLEATMRAQNYEMWCDGQRRRAEAAEALQIEQQVRNGELGGKLVEMGTKLEAAEAKLAEVEDKYALLLGASGDMTDAEMKAYVERIAEKMTLALAAECRTQIAEAEAKLAAAEAREAGLREALVHVSETIGGSRLAQLTRMRDVIDAALKGPSRQDTDAPTAYDLSAHADRRRRKP